jgi:hypothetical protein
MVQTMREAMTAKSSKPAKGSAMSAALERVRPMLVAIGGPRSWDDTKDHWRNRLARRLDMNARRVRAILSNNEKVSLSADEYLRIEARFRALDERLGEHLRALDAAAGPSAPGEVRAGGTPDQRADRQSPGGHEARLQDDRRR